MKDREIKALNRVTRVRLACNKIKHQFPSSPEGKLMFSIVRVAIEDASKKGKGQENAIRFLSGEMPQAELSGVDSEWITNILIKLHIVPKNNAI